MVSVNVVGNQEVYDVTLLFDDELPCDLDLVDDSSDLLGGNLDVCHFVLLDDEHAVDLLGLGCSELSRYADLVVDFLEVVEFRDEGLEVGVALAVIVENNEEDGGDILLLAETIDELGVVGLLDDAACDVDALDPCTGYDGGGDVGAFLLAEVTVDLVEAGDGEQLEGVEVGIVLGETAEGVEVEELTDVEAIGEIFNCE